MDVRLLGPVEIRVADRPVALPGARTRALFAVLALRAGTAVGRDELIEALWGDTPPPSAPKLVQVQVSQLRRALAGSGLDDRILTRPDGYELRLAPEELDVARVQRLLDAAEAALAARSVNGAAKTALALWRGTPLGDLADGELARREGERLEELRRMARLLAAESELARGRPEAALVLLAALAAENPLRERVHELRMLALYRSGRQADALAVYRETRRMLVDELGIEPGPRLRELHEAILRQDPELDLPPSPPVVDIGPPPARRRPRAALLAGGVAILGALLIAGVVDKRGSALRLAPNSVAVIDPRTAKVLGAIPVGVQPRDVVAGNGAIWVANMTDASVSRIDLRTRRVTRTLTPGGTVAGLTVKAGRVWTVDGAGATLTRINPAFATITRTRLKPIVGPFSLPLERMPVTAANGMVWFADNRARLVGADPADGRVRRHVGLGFVPSAIAFGGGGLWATDPVAGTITRIDRTGAQTPVPVGERPLAVAIAHGAVWVANALDGTVSHIDPVAGTGGAVRATIVVGGHPQGLAADSGGVWVATGPGQEVVRIDARADRITQRIRLPAATAGIALTQGRLWVAVQAAPRAPAPAAGRLRLIQEDDYLSNDPALNLAPTAWQVAYATCSLLMSYPERAGPAGTRLVPDAAARPPTVSADAMTYTFQLRPGLRFSPPSGAALTARTVRHTVERALSPRLGSDAASYLTNLVGERAFLAGKARHIAGVIAHGNRITFRLTAPAPEFPSKMAMPYFCAVPDDTPARRGLDAIPSAGPYYIARHAADQQLVLRPNPNYQGSRARRLREIDLLFGVPRGRYEEAVDRGGADLAANLPGTGARLASAYGAGSAHARAGAQRWFANPTLSLRFVRLNARRGLFASARMRRAANLAVDRRALATIPQGMPLGQPTDQYLPPTMPGFQDAAIYPVEGPAVARARRLAGPRRRRAVLYTGALPQFSQQAAILRHNLAAIGIDVEIRQFGADIFDRIAQGGWDLALANGWLDDYLDPSEFLNLLFEPGRPGQWGIVTPPRIARRLRAASRLTGRRRLRAYGRLDRDIAHDDAPFIALANDVEQDYFAPRIGCQLYQPVFGMDLGALCTR